MIIHDVDFDEKLLSAHREGHLVVFAGAGVSMGSPSNYPSFEGLTHKLANWSGIEQNENEPNEHYLGRLAHNQTEVHKQAVSLLSSPDSKPNKLHKNILKLFSTVDDIRIVTTNFDSHFESAAKEIYNCLPDVFRAPALPLGSDFLGIVYLHGSVHDSAKRLILTDQDFGRAYLTEAWATRFLRSMFMNYTVLFIGYSHNDTVMHYLSRGLPTDTTQPRFALVREDEKLSEWEYRGIKPLRFSFEDAADYSKLNTAVEGWVEWAHRGTLDTEQRIKRLVKKLPPLDVQDKDYLLWAVTVPLAVHSVPFLYTLTSMVAHLHSSRTRSLCNDTT